LNITLLLIYFRGCYIKLESWSIYVPYQIVIIFFQELRLYRLLEKSAAILTRIWSKRNKRSYFTRARGNKAEKV
jgi:hypothetical protein